MVDDVVSEDVAANSAAERSGGRTKLAELGSLSRSTKWLGANWMAIGVAGLLTAATLAFALPPQGSEAAVKKRLAAVLPSAVVTHVKCGVGPGLCEVVVGETLLYVDRKAEFGVVGSLLDFETKTDITAGRREELAKFAALDAGQGVDALVAGVAQRPPPQPVPTNAPVPAQQPVMANVEVSLPIEHAVVMNGGKGLPVLHVFSDLTCPYCARLHSELAGLKQYEVREYFVDFLGRGGGERGEMVLCADDPVDAAAKMYEAGSVSITRDKADCAATFGPMIKANTEFATGFGMQGTPTMVFEDGRRFPGGYAPAADVVAWIGGV